MTGSSMTQRLGVRGTKLLVAIGPRRPRYVVGVASTAALLVCGAPLSAQSGPPPPLAVEEVPFPELETRTLANGAELIVVPDHEQPFVTVNVLFLGGTSADPERQAGLAALTAELLTAGVQGQLAGQVTDDLDALGAELGATADIDHVMVSLGVLTGQLEAALAIMADVVLRPQLPADRLAALVSQARGALAVQAASPALQASRAFTRALYGPHPYGKVETPETLGRIDVQAVARFHRTFFVPDNAVFVVAGDVTAADAAGLLDRHFTPWSPGQVSLPTYFGLPDPMGRDVVLIHVPGATEAVVQAGHLLPEGDHSAWTALGVANRILGEGPGSRLHRGAEAGEGPSTALVRRRDAGVFEVRMAVSPDAVADAIEDVVAQIERLRTAPPDAEELSAVQRSLTGRFPLSVETPRQLANQVATSMMLGLDRDALETYTRRVAALTPEDIRATAADHLRPEALTVVVAGDARRLQPGLTSVGPVRVLDTEGQSIDVASLEGPSAEGYDASGLVPMTWTYEVRAQDWPAGEVRRRLASGEEDGTLRLESQGTIGPREIRRQVTFRTSTFEAVEAEDQLRVQGRLLVSRLELDGFRISGFARGPGGQQQVEGEAVPGALLGEMSEIVLWLVDLDRLDEIEVPVIGQDGRIGMVRLRARGEREVRVPAGRYDTYEIELEGGGQTQRIFVRKERPRYTVKIELVGQPVETVLTRVVEGAPDS